MSETKNETCCLLCDLRTEIETAMLKYMDRRVSRDGYEKSLGDMLHLLSFEVACQINMAANGGKLDRDGVVRLIAAMNEGMAEGAELGAEMMLEHQAAHAAASPVRH